MDSVKVTIQDNILPYLADIDIAKLLLGSEGGCCMEYKYRDKKETCHEKI